MMYHDLIMQFMTNDVEILSISTDKGKAKKKREKVYEFHQSCILVEPSRIRLRTNLSRGYLGHDGCVGFLCKFF